MKLLHNDGAPIGIYFRPHIQHESFVIRVCGNAQQTDFGVTPDNIADVYEKAIDKRLELIGQSDNADAWQTLASAYGAFLTRYGVEFKTVTRTEFKIKGKSNG